MCVMHVEYRYSYDVGTSLVILYSHLGLVLVLWAGGGAAPVVCRCRDLGFMQEQRTSKVAPLVLIMHVHVQVACAVQ